MDARSTRPGADEHAEFYAGYVARVPQGDIVELLKAQRGELASALASIPSERETYAYAAGKWTVREVVGHLADTERVFSYRALRFARGDETPVAGFDENLYVPAGRFGERTLASLADELDAARGATIALLEGLPDDVWLRRGVANGKPVTVRALANITHGHTAHHLALFAERYGVLT